MLPNTRRWLRACMLEDKHYWAVAAIVLAGDAVLTQLIIRFVSYTEIDFATYMAQVDMYEKGERNYTLITGPSGPLVYPGGHVLIHRLLSSVTSGGSNLWLAQQIYGVLYMCSVLLTCLIYRQAKGVPNYVLLLLPLSKRLHSLFMLRLFNDSWCLVTVEGAILAYTYGWDNLGSILYSSALSIKMSIFLYLPGLLVILFKRHGLLHTLRHTFIIGLLQVLVALPFIQTHPMAYFASAFEFSRVFLYKWTVNWRFVPEEIFVSKSWAMTLLGMHLVTLTAFASVKWCGKDGGVWKVLSWSFMHPGLGIARNRMTADEIVTILFTCNLIGVCFSRSLHYQFYSWYGQQIPLLLWRTKYPTIVRICIQGCIEYGWNVYPSTRVSSGVLVGANLILLAGVWA